MDYFSHRPRGYEGDGDSHLPKIVRRLRRALAKTQSSFGYDTLRLPSKSLGDLAGILVDFAEDIHADVGIWAAYERYNREFFGTALPLAAEPGSDLDAGFRLERFRHFLWIMYPTYFEELIISPTHPGSTAWPKRLVPSCLALLAMSPSHTPGKSQALCAP